MDFLLKEKKILVTGACGTVGSELVDQLIHQYDVGELVTIDNNETELFFLEQKYGKSSNVKFILSDIRDSSKITRTMRNVDIVFHTAAYKHVVFCERSPFEAVQTNILGVQNIINAAYENNIERVIFTSTDKAVNPTSVMGTSKLMGERLITAANNNSQKENMIFASTRFGNVLGSRGSVIPIFREQIKRGGPITLTDPDMTRFIMSISDAVKLVIESALIACGGEVFITKMPVINIKDLAEVMIAKLSVSYGYSPGDIPIEIIGTKPGEKMYEELMAQEETRRAWELGNYFVVLPALKELNDNLYTYKNIVSKKVENTYDSSSEKCMRKEQLAEFLIKSELLTADIRNGHPAERYWPKK